MALGLKVRHYSNSFVNDNPHHVMTKEFGEDSVDRSFFRPDISSTRSFAAANAENMKFLYDFPDGKDTGSTIQTLLRSKGLDMTEIDRIGEILKEQAERGEQADADSALAQMRELEGKKLMDFAKKYIEQYDKDNPASETVSTPTT